MFWQAFQAILMARKDSNDKTRELFDEGLKKSAAGYADYAETWVSTFQQGYLRKYQPQRYASSAKVSQHPHYIPNKRFGNMGPETPEDDSSGEGIADVIHRFRLDFLNQPSASVSDDECREAVALLNRFRLLRAQDLGEGYDVSDILFYEISTDATPTLPMQFLEALVFTPNIKDVLVKYMDGMVSVLL